jgi:hypothetical protein
MSESSLISKTTWEVEYDGERCCWESESFLKYHEGDAQPEGHVMPSYFKLEYAFFRSCGPIGSVWYG